MNLDMEKRISSALDGAARLGAATLLVTSFPNVRYLSGFTGRNGTLFLSPECQIFLTDQRYGDQAGKECLGWDVVVHGLDREQVLSQILSGFSDQAIAYEDTHVTTALFMLLTKTIESDRWIPLQDELVRLRAVKDEEEIALIRRSVAIAETGFAYASRSFVSGTRESTIAAEIEYRMALGGSEAPAFATIVAAGEHSAYPHAHPGETVLDQNDLVTVDWGAVYHGYHSDLTRVVKTGEIGEKRERLLSLTLEAFEAAMGSIKAGVTGGFVDAAARNVFAANKMEAYSLRGLGHGVGLEIHEYPRLVMGSEQILVPGMVFTVEPGLYLPGVGGVRIEHTVLLTDNGPEILSKELPLVIEGELK